MKIYFTSKNGLPPLYCRRMRGADIPYTKATKKAQNDFLCPVDLDNHARASARCYPSQLCSETSSETFSSFLQNVIILSCKAVGEISNCFYGDNSADDETEH